MSITVVSIPKENVESIADSYWSAAFNPILFELLRKDFVISASASNGGKLRITISSTTGIVAGNIVYLEDLSNNHDDGYYDVDSIDSSTTLTLDLTYVGSVGSTSYINLFTNRENYYVLINIYSFNLARTVSYVVGKLRITPKVDGSMKFDVSSVVRTLFELSNPTTKTEYASANAVMEGLAIIFKVKYTEIWQDSSNSETEINPAHAFGAVSAAMQIQNEYGSNMGKYVLLDHYEANFLTKFVEPVRFIAMPFSISYLNDIDVTVLSCRRNIVQKNIAGTTVTTIDGAVSDGATFMDRVNKLMFPESYNDTVAYAEAKIYYSTFDLTQDIKIIHDNCAYENSVYLCWLNELGGTDYWLFKHHAEYSFEISEVELFKRYNSDLAEQDTVQDITQKKFKESYAIGAEGIDIVNKDGFKSLFMSPKVLMLMNPDNWKTTELQWQTVIIAEGTWKLYRTDQSKFGVAFEIILPTLNLVSQ